MTNKNYQSGRRYEYKLCEDLRKDGFDIVQRSAGSHSPIDIWAVHKEKKLILLIQAKHSNENLKKYDKWKWLNNEFKVKFEIR
ncbi:MAG: hypothetical protein ACOC5T_09295 [Elusimicrobiota bacterium]